MPSSQVAAGVAAETAEARVLRFQSLVRLLARVLKRRLPPSIEADDLIQAGSVAVWRADGDVSKSLMRQKIWGAMVDSIRGKEYREATRVSMTQTPEDKNHEHVERHQYADPAPTVEQRMIAEAEQVAAACAARAKLQLVRRAAADPDPLFHPLTRREQRVVEFRMTGETQKTIGRAMHITQQRVSQMQRQGIQALRKKMAA